MAYAEGTGVSVIRSIGEIESVLTKYGATGFAYGRDHEQPTARLMFKLGGRAFRFAVAKPSWEEFRLTAQARVRTREAAVRLADAEEKRRWRALFMVIKALLVGVDDGIISLNDAFLAFQVLPSGTTVGEWAQPQLEYIYEHNEMPALLPGAGPRAIES